MCFYPLKHKCLLTSGDVIHSPSPLKEASFVPIHKIVSVILADFISINAGPLNIPSCCL